MKRKAVSGLMLTLLVIGMLTLAFNIQPVNASGTIYIRADGSVEGTDNIHRDGDIYTFTDNIYDEIVVERDNIVVDGAGYTVQGEGSETGSPFELYIGIYLSYRTNVTVKNVEVTDFAYGIYFSASSSIVLTNNAMSGNKYNFGLYGHDTYAHYDHTIDETNTVDGKPIYYVKKASNTVYDSLTNAGTLYLIECNNITIRDLTLTKNVNGIFLWNTTNSKIQNVTASSNRCGINLKHSSNNVLTGSNDFSNTDKGILLQHHSDNNNLTNNTVTNSYNGIQLDWNSDNNVLTGNNVSNSTSGITVIFSSNLTFANNTIKTNHVGISLQYSGDYGMNVFFHNNLINNTVQAGVTDGYPTYVNTWDNGYEGNYWSDYRDRYPDAMELDGSGIWDTPYVIDEHNQDNYPLIGPRGEVPEEEIPEEVAIGVKAGDWIKHDYTVTGWPSGTPRPEWLKVEILSVEGTTATVGVTMHMSDGTEQSDTVSVDVVAGAGTFDTLFGFVIPANCTTGDSVIMGGDGFTFNVTIDGEKPRTYAGASRTVVYASFSQLGSQLTYYWDKETGVMVEASTTSGGITGTAKATETNMWEAEPGALSGQWLWILVVVVIVVVVVAGSAVLLWRRRKGSLPEVAPTPTE